MIVFIWLHSLIKQIFTDVPDPFVRHGNAGGSKAGGPGTSCAYSSGGLSRENTEGHV